jgi:hypothetical protein
LRSHPDTERIDARDDPALRWRRRASDCDGSFAEMASRKRHDRCDEGKEHAK